MTGWLPFIAIAIAIFELIKRRKRRSSRDGSAEAKKDMVPSGPAERVIYDFALRDGDDLAYYLLKCERVVAAEANAGLCELASRRYEREVRAGRLVVLNVAIVPSDVAAPRLLSSELRDSITLGNQGETAVQQRTASSIVTEFGPPIYLKTGIEKCDVAALRELFAAGIFPAEISGDSRSPGLLSTLVENGYQKFSLTDRACVAETYGNAIINSLRGVRRFTFEQGSAGPFGEDIRSPWEDTEQFLATAERAGTGPKDIHAKRR